MVKSHAMIHRSPEKLCCSILIFSMPTSIYPLYPTVIVDGRSSPYDGPVGLTPEGKRVFRWLNEPMIP